MKLVVTQNNVGRYNLLSNEETRSFYMSIKDDNNKVICHPENENVKATIHWTGEPDEEEWVWEDPIGAIDTVIELCWKYANSVISTTNYKANFYFFVKVYQENFEELTSSYVESKLKFLEEELAEIKKKIENTKKYGTLEDISYIANKGYNAQIALISGRRDSKVKNLNETKEGTELYEKIKGEIDKYQERIDILENAKVKYYEDYATEGTNA